MVRVSVPRLDAHEKKTSERMSVFFIVFSFV